VFQLKLLGRTVQKDENVCCTQRCNDQTLIMIKSNYQL